MEDRVAQVEFIAPASSTKVDEPGTVLEMSIPQDPCENVLSLETLKSETETGVNDPPSEINNLSGVSSDGGKSESLSVQYPEKHTYENGVSFANLKSESETEVAASVLTQRVPVASTEEVHETSAVAGLKCEEFSVSQVEDEGDPPHKSFPSSSIAEVLETPIQIETSLVADPKSVEDISVPHDVRYLQKHTYENGEVSPENLKSETETESSEPIQSFSASNGGGVHENHTEIEISDTKTVGAINSSPINVPESESNSVSHAKNGVQYPEDSPKHPYENGFPLETLKFETDPEASVQTESLSASNGGGVDETPIEIQISDTKTVDVTSSPIDAPETESFTASHVENSFQILEDPHNHPHDNGVPLETLKSKTATESFTASSAAAVHETPTEIQNSDTKAVGDASSSPIGTPESKSFTVSQGENSVQILEDPHEEPYANGVPLETLKSEPATESFPASSAHVVHETPTVIQTPDGKTVGVVSSSPIDAPESESFTVSRVENSVQYPENPYENGVPLETLKSETESFPASIAAAGVHETPTEIQNSDTKTDETVSSSPIDHVTESEAFAISHVENSVDNSVEFQDHHPHENGVVSHETLESEDSVLLTQSSPASSTEVHEAQIETNISDVGALSSSLIDGPKSEAFSVSLIKDDVQNPDNPEHPYENGEVSLEISKPETETEESSMLAQSIPALCREVHETLSENRISDTSSTVEGVGSSLIDGPESGPVEGSDIGSGSDTALVMVTENEANFQGGEAQVETDISSREVTENEANFQGGEAQVETDISSGATVVDVNLEPEGCSSSAGDSKDMAIDGTSVAEVLDGVVVVEDEVTSSALLETAEFEDKPNVENLVLQKDEDNVGNSHVPNAITADDLNVNLVNEEDAGRVDIVTKPFNFLIRVPRFNDEKLGEQIREAKLQVEEKTRIRDAIQARIQATRANSQVHGVDSEYAKSEERSVRKLVRLKRMEIDSLQSVINKAKNAISIEEIDNRIHDMELTIQHETLSLKEEKTLIRDMKQLRQLREQLSSAMGSPEEIQQALEQREDAEETMKILRKELHSLKDRLSAAETTIMEAEKHYDDEYQKVKDLQAEFRAADDVRQEAYVNWQSLRKELAMRNKIFFNYKDDEAAASHHRHTRDREALYRLCTNQVENFMELWNSDSEFRRDYVNFNARSTVRRFGTLDGRSLGPDEKPTVLPNRVNERFVDRKIVSTPVKVDSLSQNVTPNEIPTKKVIQHKNQTTTATPTTASMVVPSPNLNSVSRLSNRDVSDDEPNESVKSTVEIDLIRKAEEEKRRAEAEAKLKEQRRLEELAKARDAREKKKRHDERVQMREELKARREAELKEKEREKKLRKKERRKFAASTSATDVAVETIGAEEIVEPTPQIKDVPSSTANIKAKKTSAVVKQTKAKSTIPPALRNRNKKKWQQWMWISLTSLFVILLFLMGNLGLFANVNLKRRSPAF